MLEVLRQEVPGKNGHVTHNKAVVSATPRDDGVGRRVIHHVICFAQKWRQRVGGVGDRCGVTSCHLHLSQKFSSFFEEIGYSNFLGECERD